MYEMIENDIRKALKKVAYDVSLALPAEIKFGIERPKDSSHGDFSTNVAMVLCKPFLLPPRDLALKIIEALGEHQAFSKIEIAGPGFINFYLNQAQLIESLTALWQDPHLGVAPVTHPQRVVVDYSSPNLAKEMHVGHLRSSIIGDALAKVFEFKGHQVIRQNHVGDWGTQFGMLIAHFDDEEHAHPGEVKLNDLESFYKAAKKRFDDDADFANRARQWVVLLQSGDKDCLTMWSSFINLSLTHCQQVYNELGVSLTAKDVRAESAYNDDLSLIVEALVTKGLLIEHEGAKCVFMEEFKGKDNEPLPIIVQKKDGGFLYASTDLAAIRYRHDVLHADRVLYVVDARQALHFQQVFALAYLAGFAGADMQLEHVSFGMVLDKSGRPFKSREGGVTKLADLLEEAKRRARALLVSKATHLFDEDTLAHMAKVIGISAVKYADLSKHRNSDYVFDWDSMISFEGNTAPYMLYAYTRVMSLFEKAKLDPALLHTGWLLNEDQELELAKHLLQFSEIIDMVMQKATPHVLCGYLYELAGLFSSFYESCPILNQEDERLKFSRLKLASLTAKILHQGLGLLGIETLIKM